jgi:hypothetical protein
MRRLLRRCIAAFTALATLAAPAAWPVAARAGDGERTLLFPVCTTLGVPVQAGIAVPGPSPSDRHPADDCHRQCALCAGGADRAVAGPPPGRITMPECAARAERPVARAGTEPAPGPVRLSRARDPPALD